MTKNRKLKVWKDESSALLRAEVGSDYDEDGNPGEVHAFELPLKDLNDDELEAAMEAHIREQFTAAAAEGDAPRVLVKDKAIKV